MEWTRVVTDATDNFDRSVESYANCAASNQSLVFVVIILLANIAFLVVGTFWAYKSRNIATEYNESRYIGMSIVAVLQSWTIGLPILIVVRDNPSASFYVQSGLIFVTALAIVAFTFVPKIVALRKEASGSKKRQKLYREFVREASLRRRAEEDHSDREPHDGTFDDVEPDAGDAREDFAIPTQGIKIIHNPRVRLLPFTLFIRFFLSHLYSVCQSQRNLIISGGVELSRRQLQIFEETFDNERMDRISEGEGLAFGDNTSQNVDNDVLKKEAVTQLLKTECDCAENQNDTLDECANDEINDSAEKDYENFDDSAPDENPKSTK